MSGFYSEPSSDFLEHQNVQHISDIKAILHYKNYSKSFFINFKEFFQATTIGHCVSCEDLNEFQGCL